MPKYLHETITPQIALEELKKFKDSIAWQLFCDWVESGNAKAVSAMGSNPAMTEAEMHFHRGSISNGQNMPNVMPTMVQYFENQLALTKLDEPDKSKVTPKKGK